MVAPARMLSDASEAPPVIVWGLMRWSDTETVRNGNTAVEIFTEWMKSLMDQTVKGSREPDLKSSLHSDARTGEIVNKSVFESS